LSTAIAPVNVAGVTLWSTIEATDTSSLGPVAGFMLREPPGVIVTGLG
jgi:hypothetical protein